MPDSIQLLPCVEPNTEPRALTLGAEFAYIGRACTLAEFRAEVASYDFGTIPPDQCVIHNTANPDASWAPLNNDPAIKWDRGEGGMTELAIRNKRNVQLDHIRDYYASLGWDRGPHLFIDERYIWLFTPMKDVGIHAKEGNSYTTGGRLHYTLGVETVGWFGRVGWSPSQQVLIRGAVQALQARLETFRIAYKSAPLHRPDLHQGSISLHRDYNKSTCPGSAITPAYVLSVLNAAGPDPADPWPARWGSVATPDRTSWAWAIPQKYKEKDHWQRLGKCISSALYDQQNGIVIQCFENGDIRQRSGGAVEVCFKA